MLAHPTRLTNARLAAIVLCCGTGLAVGSACSTVPEASYPAFVEHDLAADFVCAADGLVRVPTSTRRIVVEALEATPRPEREVFGEAGERWFVYRPGTAVHLRCRCRAYAADDGRLPAATDVWPGTTPHDFGTP